MPGDGAATERSGLILGGGESSAEAHLEPCPKQLQLDGQGPTRAQ